MDEQIFQVLENAFAFNQYMNLAMELQYNSEKKIGSSTHVIRNPTKKGLLIFIRSKSIMGGGSFSNKF